MSQIKAVYRHGVFEPLDPVNLREDEQVQLRIESSSSTILSFWLEQVQALQSTILRRQGTLPDSTVDIAADRTR
jgi:predicted DNA-binding antitoxin AbrB/MazE fold protein